MDSLRIIAVQFPFQESFFENQGVQACVYNNNFIYVYDKYGQFIEKKSYGEYINVVKFLIKEGKYEWTDIYIKPGEIVKRNFNQDIIIGDEVRNPLEKLDLARKPVSDITIKLFNEFLKTTNRNSREMVEALRSSFDDGLFRSEIENIIKDDVLSELSELDKEIIVRTRIEGYKYIISYVKESLQEDAHDKYIKINYFFRRVFNLEINSYISF